MKESSRYLLRKMKVKLQTQVSFSTQPALWWRGDAWSCITGRLWEMHVRKGAFAA